MAAHNAKITQAFLLDLLRENAGKGFLVKELAAHFFCAESAVNMVARPMYLRGQINCTRMPGRKGFNIYHFGKLVEQVQRPQPVRPTGDIVLPFKTNVWTPPLQGYATKLAAHAMLAMLSRR
jgi:hypothetical protein